MFIDLRHWLKPPDYPDDEEKTARARILNSLGLYFALALVVAAVVVVPLFAVHRLESWTAILILFVLYGFSRYLMLRGRLALAAGVVIVPAWGLFIRMVAISGGISSALLFCVIAAAIVIGLLLEPRVGAFLTLASILAGLGLALAQQAGIALPQFFHFSPMASWFLFALSLLFMNGVMGQVVSNLQRALRRERQLNDARRQAEATLRESEARLSSIFEATADVIFLLDVDPAGEYRFNTVNPAFLSTTGLPVEAVVGKCVRDVIPEPSLSLVLGHYRQALQERTIVRWEETSDYPTGKRTALVTVAPIIEADGACRRLVGNVHDITERKLSEEALRESERQVRGILENMQDVYFQANREGRFMLMSPSAPQVYGYDSVEELMGTPVTALYFNLEDRRRLLAELQAGGRAHDFRCQGRKKDGSPFGVSMNVQYIRDAQGQIVGTEGAIRDITERQQAEAALQKWAHVFEYAEWGVTVGSANGQTFELLNPAFARMHGYAVEELTGQPLLTVFAPEARADVPANITVAHEKGHHVWEAIHLRQDGSRFPALMDVTTVRDPQGLPLYRVVNVQDITERKQAEAALRALNASLEERVAERTAQLDAANQELGATNRELSNLNGQLTHALRSRDEFLAATSHELRTPLTSILGLSEAMELGVYGDITDRQRQSLHAIYDSGQHLLALITDILDLSKAAAGRLEVRLEPVAVADICTASQQLVRGQANKKGIKLSVGLDTAVNIVQADGRRLKQILVNLLGNAIKFTPAGGQVGLEFAADRDHNAVRFTVWDTGIGIAPATLPRLFKPFVQIDNRLNRDHAGTGLGLALAHDLVTLHGGSIAVESAGIAGQGSRFTVSLPWQPEPPTVSDLLGQMRGGRGREPGAGLPLGNGRLILVADDNPAALMWLTETLKACGFRVAQTADGVEALAQAQVLQPALIIMDVQMPGLDGLEVTRRLRRNPALATTPILALTALVMEGDRERCLAAGANDYLAKPVSLPALFAALQALLPQGAHS